MPFTHDDVITAATLLKEQVGLDPFIAVEDVTRIFRAAMHAIDTELDRVLEGESNHASAHALVLDYLPRQLQGLQRNTVVAQEHVTILLEARDVQAALIEYTIREAAARAERLLPLMKTHQTQQLAFEQAGHGEQCAAREGGVCGVNCDCRCHGE